MKIAFYQRVCVALRVEETEEKRVVDMVMSFLWIQFCVHNVHFTTSRVRVRLIMFNALLYICPFFYFVHYFDRWKDQCCVVYSKFHFRKGGNAQQIKRMVKCFMDEVILKIKGDQT